MKTKNNYTLDINSIIDEVKALPKHYVFVDSTHTEETVFLKDVLDVLERCSVEVK